MSLIIVFCIYCPLLLKIIWIKLGTNFIYPLFYPELEFHEESLLCQSVERRFD